MSIKFTQRGYSDSKSNPPDESPDNQIRGWNVEPQVINITYKPNFPYPANDLITVVYPEVEKMDKYKQYNYFVFTIEPEGSTDFIEITSEQENLTDIKPNAEGKAFFEIEYINFDQLEEYWNNIMIRHKIYGGIGNNLTLLETKSTELNIAFVTKYNVEIETDKPVYNITYNREDGTLSGDLEIEVIGYKDGVTLEFEAEEVLGLNVSNVEMPEIFKITPKTDIDSYYYPGDSFNYEVKVMFEDKIYYVFNIKLNVIGAELDFIQTNASFDYNFALDPVYFKVLKSAADVDRISLNLTLSFSYGRDVFQIQESYEYIFITNELLIYPGEEIHDFFKRLNPSWLKQTRVEQVNGSKVLLPRQLFKMCISKIEIVEYNSSWEKFKTHTFENIKWLPGKRPKSFPYLTNSRLRRTYTDSLITVCALQQHFLDNNLHKIVASLVDQTQIKEPDWVVQLIFSRLHVDLNYGHKEIVGWRNLSLEPFPNPDLVVQVVFENQNLCPDWFSFAESYEIESELDHKMTQNLSTGRKFKANVTETKTLRLNTGWILEEEIELLKELISGGLCFVKLPNHNWIKCIPVTKKPLKIDSNRKLHQQIVEFEIIENER